MPHEAIGQTGARPNEGPLVTVAIPTYNRAAFIRDAIDSVLAQTFSDFELIILDDASTDGTAEIARSYDDPRLQYRRNPSNIGMTGNWNLGFELAQGRLVALLHDDDRWAPEFLERAVQLFARSPDVGFAYAPTRPIDRQGRVVGDARLGLATADRVFPPPEALDRLVRRTEVSVAAVLVRRAAFFEAGGFRDRWPYHMDWELWIKIASRHSVGFLSEVLGYHREHDDRLSERFGRTPLLTAKDRLGMLQEAIPHLPLPERRRRELLDAAMRSLAQTQLVDAWAWGVDGDGRRARAEARFAFSIDRRVALRAPLLVAAAYAGSFLPSTVLRRVNAGRSALRAIVRRD